MGIDPVSLGIEATAAATASAASSAGATAAAAGASAATATTASTIGAGIAAGASTAAIPGAAVGAGSFLTAANVTAASALAGTAGALLSKPPKPAPAPRAPDTSGLFARPGRNTSGDLGGTFLTGGSAQVAPKTAGGKTLLGS